MGAGLGIEASGADGSDDTLVLAQEGGRLCQSPVCRLHFTAWKYKIV